MNRPEDIPEDVMAAAEERYLDAVVMTSKDEPKAIVLMIARSILEERQRMEKQLDAMRRDWCEFCDMIGVTVDTHEAVAERLIADRELIAEAKRYAAAIRKGGQDE